jgi:putative membrane protein
VPTSTASDPWSIVRQRKFGRRAYSERAVTPAPDTKPPVGPSFDEAGDAARRTHLANERTYLAWWRTGLTALAVSVGTGRLVPSLTHQTQWPYTVLGAGFALVGIVCIAHGFARQRTVREAIRRGEFEHPQERLLIALTVVGVALGVLLLVLVVVET